jgi:HPt (histidine-containing phosphotransfer) domain-containing protein
MESDAAAKANATTDAGPVDPFALRSVFGDDDATVNEILKDFVAPATSNVGEIDTAFNERSAEDVAMAAHKLKSSARSIGANELADLCQTLETAGKANDWDAIDDAAPRLSDSIQKVVDFINTL